MFKGRHGLAGSAKGSAVGQLRVNVHDNGDGSPLNSAGGKGGPPFTVTSLSRGGSAGATGGGPAPPPLTQLVSSPRITRQRHAIVPKQPNNMSSPSSTHLPVAVPSIPSPHQSRDDDFDDLNIQAIKRPLTRDSQRGQDLTPISSQLSYNPAVDALSPSPQPPKTSLPHLPDIHAGASSSSMS